MSVQFDAIWQRYRPPADPLAHAQAHFTLRRVLHEAFDRALADAGPAPRTLEIGCGTAMDSILLAQRRPGLHAVASDYSPPALEVARVFASSVGVAIEVAQADVTAMPFADGGFDLVFSQGVMEHFPDPLPGMREQARVTKSGGYVVVDVPQTFQLYTIAKQIRQWQGKWPWGWETQYTTRRLAKLGRSVGLEPVGFSGYGWWDGKPDLPAKLRKLGPEFLWAPLERAFGKWFLMNLVGLFRKP